MARERFMVKCFACGEIFDEADLDTAMRAYQRHLIVSPRCNVTHEDIAPAKCRGNDCPVKLTCWRYLMPNGEYRHFDLQAAQQGRCLHYWPMSESEIQRATVERSS